MLTLSGSARVLSGAKLLEFRQRSSPFDNIRQYTEYSLEEFRIAISPNPKEGSECLVFPVKLHLISEQTIQSPFLNSDVYDEGTF